MIKGYHGIIMKRYEELREEERSSLLKRKMEVEAKAPELLDIERKIAKLSMDLAVLNFKKNVNHQEEFSKLLRKAIEDAEKLFDHPMKQYMLFQEFAEQVEQRKLNDIPDVFAGNRHAQAYFGLFKQILPEVFTVMDSQVQDKWVALAFKIDDAVTQSVAENSINPQNIEADIRKKLLPMLFKETKAIGAGMDQAKKLVERIVQITRVGLNGA